MRRCEHCRYPIDESQGTCPNCKKAFVGKPTTAQRQEPSSTNTTLSTLRDAPKHNTNSFTPPPAAGGGCLLPTLLTVAVMLAVIAGGVIVCR
jgi:hypothetical protein